jgi:hypothetical protein
MLIGASIAFSYQLIMDVIHHHNTYPDRPKFLDHLYACTIIGTGIGAFAGGMPRYWFMGAMIGTIFVFPMTWWLHKTSGFNPKGRHLNIFYEDEVSKEEVERIQHLDALEGMTLIMQGKPGYGLIKGDPRYQ